MSTNNAEIINDVVDARDEYTDLSEKLGNALSILADDLAEEGDSDDIADILSAHLPVLSNLHGRVEEARCQLEAEVSYLKKEDDDEYASDEDKDDDDK